MVTSPHLLPTPRSTASSFEIGRSGRTYTTETGKPYRLELDSYSFVDCLDLRKR